MISASNYVDVYAARQLRNIFLIKDKLCEKENRSCICEKEEMAGPSRLMYLVKQPRLPPASRCTEGVNAKMAARAPGLQGLTCAFRQTPFL